jgi:DNA-binding transcriptional MocR family regulator
MTNWLPDLSEQSGPRYMAIADALAADVAEGRVKPGERLPTHRDLAWNLKVTVGTVSRAYAEAERRGLVSGEVGRGTYVRSALATADQAWHETAPAGDGFVDLTFNFPPSAGEKEALAGTLRQIADDPRAPGLLDYQASTGLPAHREAGAAWLSRDGLEVGPDRIVVTAGAQHAILVTLAALVRSGDRILCEAVTYPNLKLLARMLGLRLDGLSMDREGLLPDAFEAACRAGDVKALYCIPTLHNPTTATMSEGRRRDVAEIAQRHGVAILEDDILRRFADDPPPPIAAFAPEQTYFITSLSKTTAPGLRSGYVAGPEGAAERLGAGVRATCWMAAPMTAEIAARWIADGTAERILDARRRECAARRQRVLEALAPWEVDCAPGSLHLWLHLPEPWRATDFAAEARRRGVGLSPAEAFAVGRRELTHAVRLCFGAPAGRAALDRGIAIVRELLEDGPSETFGALV